MSVGLTPELLYAAAIIWLSGLLLLRRDLGIGLACFAAIVKVSLPLIFFAFYDRLKWRFFDDMDYYLISIEMREAGYTPWNTLFGTGPGKAMSDFVGAEHTLYYWFNLLAYQLFGVAYYSPVFLNVGLTFASGYMLARLATLLGFSKRYVWPLTTYFLLNWEVIAWSSFVNLKDCLVLLMTISCFYFSIRIIQTMQWIWVLPLGITLHLLTSIRHYAPVIFLIGLTGWIVIHWRSPRKYPLVAAVLIIFALLKPWETRYADYFQLGNPLYPSLRFLLMPQFWTVESPGEDFIEIPQFFHWVLFLPMCYGLFRLVREQPLFRLMALYFAMLTLFYALVPELQGVRQRFQLSFIIIWCQFHALWLFFRGGNYLSAQASNRQQQPVHIRELIT